MATKLAGLQFEVDAAHIRRRIWEVIPGILSWGTLIGLTVLSFTLPFWIAIFVIAYDVYILARIVYMSVHLIYAYRRLKEYQGIDWVERCRGVSGDTAAYLKKLRSQQQENPSKHMAHHITEVSKLRKSKQDIYNWKKVHHLIVLPTYDESLEVLRASIESFANSNFPVEQVHLVIGFEERAGKPARERAATLKEELKKEFGTIVATFHPDGLPGEKRVKSSNANWAIKKMEEELYAKGIKAEQILISNFDSDTIVEPEYFSYLTYAFITHTDRYHVSYQPIPVYNNNLWDAPSFSRVIAMGSTFWQMIESTRPERLVTFSSHSMTLKALKDVGYYHSDIISEDSRIFWQALLHYNGNYRTEPLYITVSMDAALSKTWWKTLIGQYKQKRRWAWGIENFPYLVEGMTHNKKIPWRIKFLYLFRTLEGHYSWATAAIIVAGLGWLPVFFGTPAFHTTVLSYSLPFVTRTIMTIAMSGLIISALLTFLLMPRRPQRYKRWQYVFFILQWILVPAIATVLSAFPALDSGTRLMLGRDLNFNVTEKARRDDKE